MVGYLTAFTITIYFCGKVFKRFEQTILPSSCSGICSFGHFGPLRWRRLEPSMRGVVQLPMPRALMFVCMCLSLGCGGSNSAHGHIPIEKTSVEIRSIGFEWETECTSHSPQNCKGEPRLPYYYTAAVFSVQFNETIHYDSSKSLAGSTRMICGNRIFESFQPVSDEKDDVHNPVFNLEKPPTNLNVIDRLSTTSPATLPSLFGGPAVHNNTYQAFLFLNYSLKHGYSHHVMSEEDIESCRLRFLPPPEQIIREKVLLTNAQGKPVAGTSRRFRLGKRGKCTPGRKPVTQIDVNDIALMAKLKGHMMNGKLTSLAELSSMDMSHLQTQWVGVDEYMDKVAGLADGQVATVWAATMDRWLAHEAQIVGGTLAMEMPEELAMNIKRDVYRELIPRMGSQMGEKILQSAHESMVDSVIESVSGSLHEVVPKLVTDGLAPVLTSSLTSSLTEASSVKATEDTGAQISRLTANGISSILGKSLTHSIIPALMHSMTHNPLQDYYCYYCFHKKVYCQYCNYAPSQLYYAMYYAGFYSTYYTNYYETAYENADCDGNENGNDGTGVFNRCGHKKTNFEGDGFGARR